MPAGSVGSRAVQHADSVVVGDSLASMKIVSVYEGRQVLLLALM